MIKAVITDFDGVIRHWQNDKTRELEDICKLQRGTLSNICFDAELLQPAITGKISFEQWQNLARERLQKSYGLAIAEHYIEAWQANGYRIDHGLIDTYEEYFPEAALVLATNATSRLPWELQEAGLTQRFSHVFNSSAMGVAKPKKEFFYALLMSLGINATDALFVDDSIVNVQAAKAVGIRSLHYNGRTDLVEKLTSLSLQQSMITTL